MTAVLIDCDPGMDDAVALLLALRSGALDIRAITAATGNLRADRTSANARRILDLGEAPPIPVAQGPLQPLVQPYPDDPFSHGVDGLGETGLPASPRLLDPRSAPELIIDTVRAEPGKVTLIATAPLTNVALALLEAPELATMVARIVLIGGAFGFNEHAARAATGDNPVSEWNIRVDPDAARIVFRSGAPITAIGVDVWGRPDLDLQPEHLRHLRTSSSAPARFLCQLVDFVSGRGYGTYTVLIDALAVAAVIDPTLLRTERLSVDVETKGELTLGQTVVERRAHHRWTHLPEIEAACDVDAPRFLDRLVGTLAGS